MKVISMKPSIHPVLLTGLLILGSCKQEKIDYDASGAFEAEETVISANATGTLLQLDIAEGSDLLAGQVVGYVDTMPLYLKKKQLDAQIRAMLGKKPNIPVQLGALQEQLKTAEKEKIRITNLVKADAAPARQLDDINAQIDQLKKQIEATKSSLDISAESFSREAVPLQVQIQQINDQIQKSVITNPVAGTVLTQYTKVYEITSPGKPLYKLADLSTITLRAFISGDQLPRIKLNQPVTVLTDDGNGGYRETEGIVSWISDKAEFTPKTIQTKAERANMVYAIKIRVKNDGTFKIGMYAEVKFSAT